MLTSHHFKCKRKPVYLSYVFAVLVTYTNISSQPTRNGILATWFTKPGALIYVNSNFLFQVNVEKKPLFVGSRRSMRTFLTISTENYNLE